MVWVWGGELAGGGRGEGFGVVGVGRGEREGDPREREEHVGPHEGHFWLKM